MSTFLPLFREYRAPRIQSKTFNYPAILFFILFFGISGSHSSVKAQEVVLNPGFISGTIQVGSEVIKRVKITALSGDLDSSIDLEPTDNPTSLNYSLPVQVPAGTVANYSVSVFAYTGSFKEITYFQKQSVSVTALQTSTADFVIVNPGFIEGTITVSGGGTLDLGWMHVDSPDLRIAGTTTDSSLGGHFRFPVAANDNLLVTCQGRIAPDNNSTQQLFSNISIAPGQTLNLNCGLTTPTASATAILFGRISSLGPHNILRHSLSTTGPNLFLDGNGPYSIEKPIRSFRRITPRVTTYFSSTTNFSHPYGSYSPTPETHPFGIYPFASGDILEVDISSIQASLKGKVNLTGPGPLPNLETNGFGPRAVGIAGTPTFSGRGTTNITRDINGNLNYELILSEGDWNIQDISITFRERTLQTETYINSNFSLRDHRTNKIPLSITADNPGTQDIDLSLGEIILLYRFTDNPGLTLSDPWLNGTCTHRDANGNLIHSNTVSASDQKTQKNVTVGSVRFYSPEGKCTVTARAIVNGATITFGTIEINVTPEAAQVIDIGGPTLTVQSPTPNLTINTPITTVTGLVTDDVAVAGVTVNGVSATLASTNNASDPAELSFSATIPLERGSNTISVVATDTNDKTSSDTRTVFVPLNQAPVANAGTGQIVEQQGPSGSNVTLNGSGSSDPDGDALSYLWGGPFGTATGAVPTVLIPVDTHTVTLVVNDGTVDSDPATTSVTVQDTTAPVITAPADITTAATGVLTPVNTGTATATDAVGLVSITSDQPAGFPVDATTVVTWTACDAAGNCSSATQNVTIDPFVLDLTVTKAKLKKHGNDGDKDKDKDKDNDRGPKDWLQVSGTFNEFANGDGLNFTSETVIITVDGLTWTLPAGSFVARTSDGDKDKDKDSDGKTSWKYKGPKSGLNEVTFDSNGKFKIKVKRMDLSHIPYGVPQELSIRIGNDLGETTVTFNTGRGKDDDDKGKDNDKGKKKGKK